MEPSFKIATVSEVSLCAIREAELLSQPLCELRPVMELRVRQELGIDVRRDETELRRQSLGDTYCAALDFRTIEACHSLGIVLRTSPP